MTLNLVVQFFVASPAGGQTIYLIAGLGYGNASGGQFGKQIFQVFIFTA